MSNEKIKIDARVLDGEIASAQGSASEVQSIKYEIETDQIILTSIDKYKESIALLNESIQSFATLLDNDVRNLEAIKAEWLKLDQNMVNKIFTR
ncbi:TIGR04197 family type VII secretion effector [Vagococcus sp. BWB3-3]|uniref:TIGR04197 family type VII secretion effector n=1 Tax=Vagococcus allomyrinae TaxID=2794353 RepID=A0A940PDW9_9ENTE|nr:TIGR04197 family type VII secretion effector [Vagococcus allomyrinae]MBP1043045.1 TIGR04197 family type VII secretion effector [Vagococcus allomyrinae]